MNRYIPLSGRARPAASTETVITLRRPHTSDSELTGMIASVGIAWPGDRPVSAPAAAFRDFAVTYAGRLPH